MEQHCGGIIGLKFNNTSKKTLSFILSFASGLMMAIICFDLIPEALKIAEFSTAITGIILGIV
ncbi:MAG: ZIP family metal transporter, partial [Clostridia bacterium]|nr:ZIP family metal transporter [Clostridia bacterium]